MSSIPDRSEVDEEYKWNLDVLYPDDDAWEDAFEEAREMIEDLTAFEGVGVLGRPPLEGDRKSVV